MIYVINLKHIYLSNYLNSSLIFFLFFTKTFICNKVINFKIHEKFER